MHHVEPTFCVLCAGETEHESGCSIDDALPAPIWGWAQAHVSAPELARARGDRERVARTRT